jgi:hypothetical protein
MTSAEWQTALILLAGLAPVFAADRISHGCIRRSDQPLRMRLGIRCHESAPQKYLRHAAFDNPEGQNLPETTSYK